METGPWGSGLVVPGACWLTQGHFLEHLCSTLASLTDSHNLPVWFGSLAPSLPRPAQVSAGCPVLGPAAGTASGGGGSEGCSV